MSLERRQASAAVIRSLGGDFVIEDVTLDGPRSDELLVRVVGAGICHTDLAARDGSLPFSLPAILGHEGSGIVEAVGDAVTGFAVGESVVLNGAYCGLCPTCLDGKPVYCPEFPKLSRAGRRADGSPTVYDAAGEPLFGTFVGQSSFSTLAVVRATNAIRVSAAAPLELLGPLGCGVMTGAGGVMDTLQPPAGSSIAVFGLGGVGMSAVIAAGLVGCSKVIAVDLNRYRLDVAMQVSATHAVDASGDPLGDIQRLSNGGVDFAIDASGVASVGQMAVESTHGQGTSLLLGAPAAGSQLTVPWSSVLRGRTIRGAIMGGANPRHFIPRMVDLIAQGRFPLDRLVRYFEFGQIGEAAHALETGEVIKPVVLMPV
jgi:aryl-alcohol dehydrogenase